MSGPKSPISEGPTGLTVRTNVRNLRIAQGLSQREFVEKIAATGRPMWQSAVTALERGGRRIDVDDLAALAEALGVTPVQLLSTDCTLDGA